PSGSVHTGFRPTQRDENNRCGHPRVKLALSLPKGGSTSVRKKLDSRFRGNGRYGRFSNFDFPISIFHFPASVRKKLDSLFRGNGRYGRFSNFDFPFSSFHFPVSPSQPLQEKQLEHKQPGSYHNGAVGKIERGPMIAAVVNVQEVHDSTQSDTIEEIGKRAAQNQGKPHARFPPEPLVSPHDGNHHGQQRTRENNEQHGFPGRRRIRE